MNTILDKINDCIDKIFHLNYYSEEHKEFQKQIQKKLDDPDFLKDVSADSIMPGKITASHICVGNYNMDSINKQIKQYYGSK